MIQQKLYEKNISSAEEIVSGVTKKITIVSFLRLLVFLLGLSFFFFFTLPFAEGWGIWFLLLLVVVTFLYLVKLHNKLFVRREWLRTFIKTNKDELKAVAYDFSAFQDGKEFLDDSHSFSFDLDVFGANSIFQSINRTTTQFGRNALANIMINPPSDGKIIKERQTAIKELEGKVEYRQKMRTSGLLCSKEEIEQAQIRKMIDEPICFYRNGLFKILLALIPALHTVLFILSLLHIISWSIWGYFFMICAIAAFTMQKRITMLQNSYGKLYTALSNYSSLLLLFEQEHFDSELLKTMQKKLLLDSETASKRLDCLSKQLSYLDQRNNILVSVFLDGLFLWQIRTVMKIERWKEKNSESLFLWLATLGNVEELASLATFAYNNSAYSEYPSVSEAAFCYKGEDLRHPLMPYSKAVGNMVNFQKNPYFFIVTGANMAGKSTYLRTLGSNYLLFLLGAPVCGKNVEASPVKLVTSLRTNDSLYDGESYFFSELKRMKLIIDRLLSGEKLFILLDEILRGTNSTDKQKGTLAFVTQLMELGGAGVIATHDVTVASLANEFPDNVSTYCFEADIRENALSFNYKIRPGVVSGMNACFLMKKMGIKIN